MLSVFFYYTGMLFSYLLKSSTIVVTSFEIHFYYFIFFFHVTVKSVPVNGSPKIVWLLAEMF